MSFWKLINEIATNSPPYVKRGGNAPTSPQNRPGLENIERARQSTRERKSKRRRVRRNHRK